LNNITSSRVKNANCDAINKAALKDAYRIKPDLTELQIMYLVGRRQADELLTL
jgi:hypothetical protein